MSHPYDAAMGSLAERIALIKRQTGLTNAGLAERLGVTASAVSQWLHGGRINPGRAEAFRELGYNPGWVLSGEGAVHLNQSAISDPEDSAPQLQVGDIIVTEADLIRMVTLVPARDRAWVAKAIMAFIPEELRMEALRRRP